MCPFLAALNLLSCMCLGLSINAGAPLQLQYFCVGEHGCHCHLLCWFICTIIQIANFTSLFKMFTFPTASGSPKEKGPGGGKRFSFPN